MIHKLIKFNLLGFFLIITFYGNCLAQTNSTVNPSVNGMLPNVVSASPEAASLGKYGFWPVSHYTGVPDISIPIYNITIGDFNLPITLRYHAGGVKVDDISSWVGVNWSLNAGGMIGRTVVDYPDDYASGGFAHHVKAGLKFKDYYNLNVPKDYYLLKESADFYGGQNETKSDNFYYNFAGFSGKFLVDSTFNIRTIPASNLQFAYTPFSMLTGISYFPLATDMPQEGYVVVDEKGNIYKFANSETTRAGIGVGGSQEGGQDFTSGYYLSQIILANRVDTIRFEYGIKKEIFDLPAVQSYREILNLGSLPPLDPRRIPPGHRGYSDFLQANRVLYNGRDNYVSSARRQSHTNGYTSLERITWRGGKVEFFANTARQDMLAYTGTMLDSIKIYDSRGIEIINHNLNYSYIGRRYYLSSVVASDKGKTVIRPYKFEYDRADQLPQRNFTNSPSTIYYCAQDHWGFYNGFSNITNLLPPNSKFSHLASTTLIGKREPNMDYVACGTISKIIYPTGGYTEFKYEANRYAPGTPSNEGNPTQPIVDVVKNVIGNRTVPFSRSVSFNVPFDQSNGTLKLRIYNYSKPPGKGNFHLPYMRIKRGNNNVYYNDAFDTFPTTAPSPNPDGSHNYEFNVSNLQLLKGDYIFTVSDTCLTLVSCMDAPDPRVAYMEATLTYSGYGDLPDTGSTPLPITGGIRVKEILNYSQTGAFAERKSYEYNPGNLLAYPSDYTRYYDLDIAKTVSLVNYGNTTAYNRVTAQIIETTNTPQTILGYTQGAPVGYTEVRERQLDVTGKDIGYTDYNYSFNKDTVNTQVFNMYWNGKLQTAGLTVPPNSYEYKRGLLLSSWSYKRMDNGTYLPISIVSNSYDFNDFRPANHYYRQKNLHVNRLNFFDDWANWAYVDGFKWPAPLASTETDFSYSFYDVISAWVQLVSREETKYDQNGTNPVKTVTNYQYNTKNLLASQVTSVTSGGDKTVTRITYPVDYTITGTPNNDIARGINNLKQQYITAAPVEHTVSKENSDGSNKRALSSTLYTYKPAIARPSAVFATNSINPMINFAPISILSGASVMDSRYEIKSLFQQYDQYGNIIEFREKAGATVCYIWGYKGQYPIAEIKNATYSDVLTKLGGQTVLNQLNNSSVTEAFIVQKMEALRTALPAAHITSYTYQPLVGMRSKTDPRGVTEYYEYDGMQRLKAVLDQFKNVTSALDYNYRPN